MSTISASTTTTTAYKVTADTTGTLVLQTGSTPTTAVTIGTNQVVTFAQQPAGTFAGTGPAFSAYGTTTQSIANGTQTKLTLNNEIFDTASCFDSTTNYRFTPTVAGYYQISGSSSFVAGVSTQVGLVNIYKNGSQLLIGSGSPVFSTIQNFVTVSGLVYLNGSTDYVELYTYHNYGSSWNTSPSATTVWMTGALVRAA